MKNVLLALITFIAFYASSQSIPNFPGSNKYTDLNGCRIQLWSHGKFILRYTDECIELGYDEKYNGCYIYDKGMDRDSVRLTVNELTKIINFYRNQLGLDKSVNYFNPLTVSGTNSDLLFDKNGINYDEIWKNIQIGLMSTFAVYELVPGELEIEFYLTSFNVGFMVIKK